MRVLGMRVPELTAKLKSTKFVNRLFCRICRIYFPSHFPTVQQRFSEKLYIAIFTKFNGALAYPIFAVYFQGPHIMPHVYCCRIVISHAYVHA